MVAPPGARGNERKKIFRDESDCLEFLELLAEAVRRYDWMLHSFMLMVDHYHLADGGRKFGD